MKAAAESPSLNVVCLQHAEFEGPAGIGEWLKNRKHHVTVTRLDKVQMPPPASSVDWLIVMGGPMNVYEYRNHPWLRPEKQYIKECIQSGKTVLGICLGAQLIADVLGAKVYQNLEKEIGWFPVYLNTSLMADRLFQGVPKHLNVFHWHGDTFDLPQGATCLASSAGCAQQAFAYGERVVGLQFHIEMTPASVGEILQNCGDEIIEARFIQSARDIAGNTAHFAENLQALGKVLTAMETGIRKKG
jgi:GMP synthase-like glutamine amidotransferase